MAQVTIRINGYPYSVGCEAGEERHVQAMAHELEKRVTKVRDLGFSGESKVLVMAALIMADELGDVAAAKLPASTTEALVAGEQAVRENEYRTNQLYELADRAEAIAAELERS